MSGQLIINDRSGGKYGQFGHLLIINLIYIAQFDTNGIFTALYIAIQYIQMQYVHI